MNTGGLGYRKRLLYGDISVFYDGNEEMGVCVSFSGQGCRVYESQFENDQWIPLFKRVFEHEGHFTRCDLAIDNVDGQLKLEEIKNNIACKEIRSKFRYGREQRKFSLSRNPDEFEKRDGHTIYFGSPTSRIQFRIYDKAVESGCYGHWVRFELELRKERANIAILSLIAGESVGLLTCGIINNYLSFINLDDSNISRCSLKGWWTAWLLTTGKMSLSVAKAIKYVKEVMEFVKKQYAPSFAMIREHLGVTGFWDYLRDLLDDGSERMSVKHQQILAVSAL